MDAARFVDLGQFAEFRESVLTRLVMTENDLHGLRGAEQEHRAMEDRLAVLEQASREHGAEQRGRRDRLWVIVIGLTTGIVCPLIVTTAITWLHLRALG